MATIRELTERLVEFRDARHWRKYHTPRNLLISLVAEIGELCEVLQWKDDSEILENIDNLRNPLEDELADVAIYLMLLANELGVDLEKAVLRKIKKNEERYPVNAVKGRYRKYTELER